MIDLVSVSYAGEYRVEVVFNTGEKAVVDLHDVIFKFKAAESLRSPEAFATFHLDEWPTIVWDCGFDLSPEYLYELATGKRPAWAE